MKQMLKKTILMLAVTLAAGLLFVNIYTSVVDAPNWGRDIPTSLMAAREYFQVANPGTFFRVFSPANQLITLAALIICWRAGKQLRVLCGLALVCAIVAEVMTFAFFYPRNELLFVAPIGANLDIVRSAWSQWSNVNWIRSALIGLNLIFDFAALMKVKKVG